MGERGTVRIGFSKYDLKNPCGPPALLGPHGSPFLNLSLFEAEFYLCMYVGFYFFQLKEETNRDYSFPAGLEDHILGENISPNMSISGLVPSELTQSNTSLGSSSSSGDVGKLHYSPGKG